MGTAVVPHPCMASPVRPDGLRIGAGLMLDIRPMVAADSEALQAHVRGLSMRSRHNRYLGGVNELARAEVERLLGGAGGTVFPLVAELVECGRRTMVGEAVYAIDRSAGTVEFALSVRDDWQGRGIGAALLGAIAVRAGKAGAGLLHGETLRGNDAMLALAAKVGAVEARHRDDPRLVRIERRLAAASAALAA